MKLDLNLYLKIKEILCLNIEKCISKEDLREIKDFEFHLKFYVNDDINKPQKLDINLTDIYSIKDDGNIDWYIDAFIPP